MRKFDAKAVGVEQSILNGVRHHDAFNPKPKMMKKNWDRIAADVSVEHNMNASGNGCKRVAEKAVAKWAKTLGNSSRPKRKNSYHSRSCTGGLMSRP